MRPKGVPLMKDPRDYLREIQENLKKLQSQKNVTPSENALFGMIDGLAGLQLVTMERLAVLEQALQGRTGEASRRRAEVIDVTHRAATKSDDKSPDAVRRSRGPRATRGGAT